MVKHKEILFVIFILFFLLFSFSPTLFELYQSNKLADQNREFILEHNYYWPDFNLYLSKIRQGWEGRLTALERYTSEIHQGSLIQEFYVILGLLGRTLNLDPNFSYQLGRLILSPLLLIMIVLLVKFYFKSFLWQVLAFLVVVTSGSFPRFFTDTNGVLHVGRFMEWWSNIDALQRITFIPHILFGQVVSFFLLYRLAMKQWSNVTMKQLIFYILLGNLVGLVFPPSLITLNSVLLLILIIKLIKQPKIPIVIKAGSTIEKKTSPFASPTRRGNFLLLLGEGGDEVIAKFGIEAAFIISTLPSLIYLFFITKQLPWSALVDFHKTHPMMIPLDQYILGTGPIIFLGLFGAIISIIKGDKKWQPLIFWVLVTFSFASLFSVIKEQSPLRFTQTGLFIPLGILGAYFFYQLYHLSNLSYLGNLSKKTIRTVVFLSIIFYLSLNLFMMKVSFDWQTTFIRQRVGASIPPVPYPPQTMYPIKAWMDGIRFLRDNTNHDDVVLAEITAGNFIPAYAGNTVYFGQSNTVDYDRKQIDVDKFFSGKMNLYEAQKFLLNGRIKYIFESVQEKDLPAGEAGKSGGKSLQELYPFLNPIYNNSLVTIYKTIFSRNWNQ